MSHNTLGVDLDMLVGADCLIDLFGLKYSSNERDYAMRAFELLDDMTRDYLRPYTLRDTSTSSGHKDTKEPPTPLVNNHFFLVDILRRLTNFTSMDLIPKIGGIEPGR
jgi:hypothetical protein